MRKVVPVLLILLLVPVGYYIGTQGKESGSTGYNGTSEISFRAENLSVVMKLDRGSYAANDTLQLVIINRGKLNATTGYGFRLYRLENGKWVEVPVRLMFIQTAVIIPPGKEWEQGVKLSDLDLKPGHYRIVKSVVLSDQKTHNAVSMEVWAEFDVT